MGQFTIDLPESKKGDVRWGTVSKMQLSLFHKSKSESKKGYIITVSDSNNKTVYHLYKSKNGEWSKDPEGEMGLDNNILILIRDAIIGKELSEIRSV